MTFSIVARCARTGHFGAAICSSSPAVAARCIRARARVGVAASQNLTDPSLGSALLDAMETGASATEALDSLVRERMHIGYRQLSAVDATGRTGVFTGDRGLGIVAQARANDVACAGNLLARPDVVPHMLDAFLRSDREPLAERLLLALDAALQAGGEAGPVHSAGLLVVGHVSWPIVDLRCDWTSADPVGELHSLWKVFGPQVDSYTLRALHPDQSPTFGVAGDP
jgi:uncharacterized Ntn-hydrolase superfamily protein